MSKLVFYDKENDILAIHNGFSNGERFKGNIDIGELILDVSTNGKIRGIEIMNASEFLNDFKIEKEILENLADARLDAVMKPNSVIIGIQFITKSKQELSAKIAVPMTTHRFVKDSQNPGF